jgi:hypothetical protein
MNFYPYTSPIILDDNAFQIYGGSLDNSTPEQRQAAYLIAEMTASDDLNTFLQYTDVTGTYRYDPVRQLVLDHTYVHNIRVVQFIDMEEDIYYTVSGTANVHVSLRDDVRSIVDINYLVANCQCNHGILPYPYQIRVMYQAGLPTGTSTQPNVLLALTTYADIVLNEIIGYGNEAPGDVGVQSFSNLGYSEKRVGLVRTMFGTSARAQFASRLLNKLRKLQHVGL